MATYMVAVMVDFKDIVDLIYIYTFTRYFMGYAVVVFVEFYVIVRGCPDIVFDLGELKRACG